MPRKSSKPAASKPDAEEVEIDIAADVEAVDAEPVEDIIVEVVEPGPESPPIPADEQVQRFTLDNPPARIAHLPRRVQKPIILQANLWIARGIEAPDALTRAIGGR